MSDLPPEIKAAVDTTREWCDKKHLEVIADRDRLRAIVNKLPRTVDGVPVVPGMEVVTMLNGNPHKCVVPMMSAFTYSGQPTYGHVLLCNCYSTREAAEAAAKEGKHEHG